MMPIIYLFVMILAQTIFHSVDVTMLGLIHGDYEVGIYTTAHKILNIINQVVGSLLWVIMPRMSYYFAEQKYDEVNQLLRKVLGFNILLGLPCIVVSTLLHLSMAKCGGHIYRRAYSTITVFLYNPTVSVNTSRFYPCTHALTSSF